MRPPSRRRAESQAVRPLHRWLAALLLSLVPLGAHGAEQAAGSPPDGSVKRGTVVPDSVKEELREELTHDVLEEAKRQNFGAPNVYPDWTRRFSFSGDV